MFFESSPGKPLLCIPAQTNRRFPQFCGHRRFLSTPVPALPPAWLRQSYNTRASAHSPEGRCTPPRQLRRAPEAHPSALRTNTLLSRAFRRSQTAPVPSRSPQKTASRKRGIPIRAPSGSFAALSRCSVFTASFGNFSRHFDTSLSYASFSDIVAPLFSARSLYLRIMATATAMQTINIALDTTISPSRPPTNPVFTSLKLRFYNCV